MTKSARVPASLRYFSPGHASTQRNALPARLPLAAKPHLPALPLGIGGPGSSRVLVVDGGMPW